MYLNMKTVKDGASEIIGLRMYSETVKELDAICDELNVKRSVIMRHAINEFIDNYKGEE